MPTQPTSRRTANYQQQEIVDLNEKEVAIIKKKIGTGNIDLYEHDLEITGTNIDVLVTIYSSKNTKIDSLTDLKLVCGDTFMKPCNGQVNGKVAYAITQTSIKLVDGTTQLLTGVTYNDNLTTI